MKDFLKYTLATIVGIMASALILTFGSVMLLLGMLTSGSDAKTEVRDNALLVLDMNGTLKERSQDNAADMLYSMFYGDTETTYGLDDILSAIKKARDNSAFSGILIKGGTLDAQPASLEAIHDALKDFKESGKSITAYADNYDQSVYYLASVADKVIMNPHGTLDIHGLGGQVLMYKGLLDKVGVKMEVFKVGTFKSAVEPYMLNTISEANKEQMSAYIGSIWHTMASQMAENRGISEEQINIYADDGMSLADAENALHCGLVDTLMYMDDVRSYLKAQMGLGEKDTLPLYDVEDMKSVIRATPRDRSGNVIAVYYATGEIDASNTSALDEAGISSDKMIRDLRQLRDDNNVKAVVLRVNSPGGSAYGSEQIWYALKELRASKPLIVSMGDYAASGGYYISCGADSIVAQPTTLTGSVGIFGMMPNVKELADKIGVHVDVVKTNRYTDLGSTFRDMTEGEKALMQRYVEEGYDLFLERCCEGRRLARDYMDKVGQGRVWTGEMALQLGLVDKLGSMDDAIDMAAGMSGVEAYTVMTYPEKEDLWSSLLSTGTANYIKQRITGSTLKGEAARIYDDISSLSDITSMDRLQARMPYDVKIR